jgi:hypothetical protein
MGKNAFRFEYQPLLKRGIPKPEDGHHACGDQNHRIAKAQARNHIFRSDACGQGIRGRGLKGNQARPEIQTKRNC